MREQETNEQLKQRVKELTKERDDYYKQLREERKLYHAGEEEQREGDTYKRLHTLWAEATRNYLRSSRVFASNLPSRADMERFEDDDWQRYHEVHKAVAYIHGVMNELCQQTSSVVDAEGGMSHE